MSTRTHLQDWLSEHGLRAAGASANVELILALLDGFARQLIPAALRTLALEHWAQRFAALPALRAAVAVEHVEVLREVMAEVMALGHQHLFFTSFLHALEVLAMPDPAAALDLFFADSGPWSMACRRLSTILGPEKMSSALQAILDDHHALGN